MQLASRLMRENHPLQFRLYRHNWITSSVQECIVRGQFLPERDYVTVRVFAIVNPSVVCRLSVTLVHPTQVVEPFGKISSPLCTLAIL